MVALPFSIDMVALPTKKINSTPAKFPLLTTRRYSCGLAIDNRKADVDQAP